MATGSSSPTEVDLACQLVERVRLLEGVDGDYFAIDFALAGGETVRLGFAHDRADELMFAIHRSRELCARRRDAARN